MQYSRPMIDLVMQIRKFVPSELKPDIKLANPELFSILVTYYHGKNSTVTNALIKELFHLAGDQWSALIDSPPIVSASQLPAQSVRVYRGQTQLTEKTQSYDTDTPQRQEDASPKKKATKKIYRGQVIYE